jgi:hypothetical protein
MNRTEQACVETLEQLRMIGEVAWWKFEAALSLYIGRNNHDYYWAP